MLRRITVACVLLATAAVPLRAQEARRVATGWGVDTTSAAWSDLPWHADAAAIYRAWRDFLRATPGTPAADALWSASERRRWPAYDLTAATGAGGFPATVLDIRPAPPGQRDTFVVKTLFAAAVGEEHDVKPAALTRVYAVREGAGWRFANALPRLTTEWRRVRVGPITYVVTPGHPFDAARAERAVHFADSLATAFDVPRIDSLTYYVADSPEELFRAMGVDWSFGGQGYGYAIRADRLLLSGDPGFGEANLHELTHYVLSPLVKAGRTNSLVSEGVASWLGGSMSLPFPHMVREYAAFLRSRPEATLDSVMASGGPDLGVRPAGAMVALMVFQRGGVPAVKELLVGGSSDEKLRGTLQRLLGMPWPQIEATWRRRVLAYGASGGPASWRPEPRQVVPGRSAS